MGAVYADEALPHSADAQMVGEQRDAPAAVPAHGRFAAVGVEIAHAEFLRRSLSRIIRPSAPMPVRRRHKAATRSGVASKGSVRPSIMTKSFPAP